MNFPMILVLALTNLATFANENLIQHLNKDNFFFGVSNAANQVEGGRYDVWHAHARKGHVAAYNNQVAPLKRLDFWKNPEVELDLAKELGVNVFRLSVDWERIIPYDNHDVAAINYKAIERYREILKMIKDRGMKVMLTLFHHSEPKWTLRRGSWNHTGMIDSFYDFSKIVINELGSEIDYLITFNESWVYVLLTKVLGIWPNDGDPTGEVSGLLPILGEYQEMLQNMAVANKRVYQYAKLKKIPHVGVAHNIADNVPAGFKDEPGALYARRMFSYYPMDIMIDSVDFIGLNYYGAEVIKWTQLGMIDEFNYSDSGRAISPKGLLNMLRLFHERYNLDKKGREGSFNNLPILITENGLADSKDIFRPAYITEHLLAINKAIDEGIPVKGYVHWTLSDNFEWSDGYCPKFGLVHVDRNDNLKRRKRSSFYLYRTIIDTRFITSELRDLNWQNFAKSAGKVKQDFCRDPESGGKRGYDRPVLVDIPYNDWRFDRYDEIPGDRD